MPADTTRGADCEACDIRMNSRRATNAAEKADENGGALMCGACRDAANLQREVDGLKANNKLLDEILTALRLEHAELVRLLGNATDPRNAGDWDEAREMGWTYLVRIGVESPAATDEEGRSDG